jgi:hypothetical protein
MPETGAAIRFEVQSVVEDQEKELSETLLEAAFPEVKFKTALELRNSGLERPEHDEPENNPS